MSIDSVKSYLRSTVKTPYFVFISDREYLPAINELEACGLTPVPISSFCNGEDKIPDIDGLFNYIDEADINVNGKKFFVTGLGEFLALRGTDEAKQTLSRLKELNVGGAKVVLLLRGLTPPLIAELETDLRFDARRHCVIDRTECDLSCTLVAPSVGLPAIIGFKALLAELENGKSGDIVVRTAITLDNAICTLRRIDTAYEGIKFLVRDFEIDASFGTDDQWTVLLTELDQAGKSLDSVFEKYGFNNNPGSDFYACIAENNYRSWLYFVYLKSKANTLQNTYLRFVLDKANGFENFVGKFLNAINEIHHTDERFVRFYRERKTLIEKFPEPNMAAFVTDNRRNNVEERIYRLTDNSSAEREEIVLLLPEIASEIAGLSKNNFIRELESIYPDLASYMKKYVFKCLELADLLTEYFEDYKRQKLTNQLEPAFLKKVEELAMPPRVFNQLPTRDEILDSMDKNGAYLYWLDSLGVEYLSLIEALAQKRDLSMQVSITRARLPTITSVNRGFFDAWKGSKNGDNGDKALDDTKHKNTGGYNSNNNELPIHLAKELSIIVEVMDKAATELALGRCKRFVIASDHGASRLAVLHRNAEKYDSGDTSGEHSGRCCKLFKQYDLPFASEENGYLVLADYGRFKGSRAANVEVHGGASLEEVVVPVIELSQKDTSIRVEIINKTVVVDYRTGAQIELFVNAPVKDISVVLNEKSYSAVQADANRYSVTLADIKRTGNYPADVYAGDNLIGKIEIKAQSKLGKVNDDFGALL